MSDRPDDMSKEAWDAMFTRWLDQARREGYAAGVRAAAEVMDRKSLYHREEASRLVNGSDEGAVKSTGYHVAAGYVLAAIAENIRALDGKGGGV